MSSPGTVEWFVERGVPEPQAAQLAAIEAGHSDGCVPAVDSPAPADPDEPVVGAGELEELADLDEPLP